MGRLGGQALVAGLRERIAREPVRGSIVTGLVLSAFSMALSFLALGALGLILPSSHWGPSAAAGLGGLSSGALFFTAVLYVPPFETLVGQVVPIETARRLGAGPLACTWISAAVFGLGHFLNGGVAHGLTTFVAGLVFAFGYGLARPSGFWPSFLTAATAHAAHNAVLLFVLAPLFPQLR